MPPKSKAQQGRHLDRITSNVHAVNASGQVARNFHIWTDGGTYIQQHPQQAFVKCLVLPGSTAEKLKVRQVFPDCGGLEFEVPSNRVWNATEDTVDALALRDIGLLQHQNTAAVLYFLYQRFMKDSIYTTADPLMVAINPYRNLGITTDAYIKRYHDAPDVTRLPPHVFTVARQAQENLHNFKKSQTVIVTGESGAGKTEATKHCMRFFAHAQGNMDLRIQEAVMAANPVLESFGNAKTLRNNNSSRFGRFMQLVIGPRGGILNGIVQGFLLEKVRVVSQQPGERSYHIFYQFLKGASPQEKREYNLGDIKTYRNLNAVSGGCYDAPGINDLEEFKEVRQSLHSMQLTPQQVATIFSVVSGVLKLGNVEFIGKNIDGQDNAADFKADSIGTLKEACQLLFLDDFEKVSEGLRSTIRQIGKEEVTVRVTKTDADTLCQSLGKAMYDKLFQWIIKSLNKTIRPAGSPEYFMGMLDIFGFEIFENNSLEQLLINITNEFLQKNFVDIVFERESRLYREEGISAKELKFTNNSDVIDCLIGKRMSVFAMLEDACVTKGASDEAFYSTLGRTLSSRKSYRASAKGSKDLIFEILHTIAPIEYSAKGFIDKNMDLLKAELAEVAKTSSNPVVREMFEDVSVERGKLAKGQLIASQFLRQLDDMMSIILVTEPHFIRCVKANETKKPLDWDNAKVLNQLFSLSILEALQLKQLGFAWRRPFKEFVLAFRFLDLSVDDRMQKTSDVAEQKRLALQMVERIGSYKAFSFVEGKDYQIGKTMVFLKPEVAQSIFLTQRQALEDFVPSVQFIGDLYAARERRAEMRKQMSTCIRVQAQIRQRLVERRGMTTPAGVVVPAGQCFMG